MTQMRCEHCGAQLAHARGGRKLRLVRLPVVVVRLGDDGVQRLESVCPTCRRDVSFVLPLDPRVFRDGAAEQPAPRIILRGRPAPAAAGG